MPAPLGVRACPVPGCRRPIHVTPGETVWARCLSHGLHLVTQAYAAPSRVSDSSVSPAAASDTRPVAVPAHRPAA